MKLKQIPNNTVVYTPTEAEAEELLSILHENGYEWNNKKSLIGDPTEWGRYKNDTVYFIDTDIMFGTVRKLYRCQYITLADFKERYALNEDNFVRSEEDKPQPKFNKGDKIAVRWINKTGTITNVRYSEEAEEWEYDIKVNPKGLATALEHNITLYTEPETKPTEDMEAIEKQKGEKGNNSENSQLDLCELLCEGDTVYSLINGEGKVEHLDEDSFCVNGWPYKNDGTFEGIDAPKSYCLIFPSRAIWEQYPLDPYTAWMEWQEEQKKFALDVNFRTYDTPDFGEVLYFHTPADRDKCIEEIKAIIEKYSK